jgi:hypothetical protein
MMRGKSMKFFGVVLLLAVVLIGGVRLPDAGAIGVGILSGDDAPPTANLDATGLFDSVTFIGDISYLSGFTPTLAQLTPYDAILLYTDAAPADPTGLGNVLADYVIKGGGLVMNTYSFSSGLAIAGDITNPGYSPLTNLGTNGRVTAKIKALVPGDPIFSGVNLATMTYFRNVNYAYPGLDTGAILLAVDGNRVDMIARNSSGNIIGMNIYPGLLVEGNNAEFYHLLGNSLVSVCGDQPVPLPGAIWLLGSGLRGLVGWRRVRTS